MRNELTLCGGLVADLRLNLVGIDAQPDEAGLPTKACIGDVGDLLRRRTVEGSFCRERIPVVATS